MVTQEGSRPKQFAINPVPQQDGNMFFSLSGKGPSGQQKINVTVSPPEFKVRTFSRAPARTVYQLFKYRVL
jgi:hypothetical protein